MSTADFWWRIIAVMAIGLLLVLSPAWAGALPAPDDQLTPGATRTGSPHAKRPPIPMAVIREVARRYGIALAPRDKFGVHDVSCGRPRCELDHRIPFGCLGATTADNLSYQTAAAYPRKDRLEHHAERQVALGKMTVADCQKMFTAPSDWRDRYREIFGP
jgi:hypothetical protein